MTISGWEVKQCQYLDQKISRILTLITSDDIAYLSDDDTRLRLHIIENGADDIFKLLLHSPQFWVGQF